MGIRETHTFYFKDKVEIKCNQTMRDQVQITISDEEENFRLNVSLKVCKKLKKKLSRFLDSVNA